MNKIHRTLWNATLGAYVAAPENARAGHGSISRARRKLTPLALLFTAAALASAPPALAAGGAGGLSYAGVAGGPGGVGTGAAGAGGGSNGGEGGGGGGGAAGSGAVAGGAGGTGGAGGAGGGAGGTAVNRNGSQGGGSGGSQGAGGGGGGFSAATVLNLSNAVTLTGGNGGSGGVQTSAPTNGGGGGGGEGGAGAVLAGSGASVNTGTVRGGAGGAGGNSAGGRGGNGGDGGIGAQVTATGVTLTNAGTIAGGNGGTRGTGYQGDPSLLGQVGRGGVGITGSNLSVVNSGTISGGVAGDGATRANAITLGGTGNTLELQAGSNISGNVVGSTVVGATNALVLGGAADATFAASGIGSQYLNFNRFSKTGSSVWTLTGTTAAVTAWTVSGGTLSIASDASLGASSGALTLDGGTLRTTANMTATRAVAMGAAGGTFSPNAGTTLVLGGVVAGVGGLTQAGAGTLVLAANNIYGGTTTISAGTLQVGNGGTTGTLGAGAVINNAALVFNRSDSVTVANAIGGSGTLTQAGAGTTVLTGANSYGATTITAGALQVGDGGTTGTLGTGAVTNNAALVFNRSDSVTVANAIGGSGSVTQSGAGTLALSGANSYGGGTTLNTGTLLATSNSALGTGVLTINGGTLGGSSTLSNAVTVNADFNATGFGSLSGDVTLNGPVRITSVATQGYTSAYLVLTGAIGGTGGLTLDSSLAPYGSTQVQVSGATSNTYSGNTTVSGTQLVVLSKTAGAVAIPGDLTIEGTAIVAATQGQQIASTSTVTVNSVGQAIANVTGTDVSLEGLTFATWAGGPITQTLAALNGSGTVSLSDATLRLGAGNFSGVISNGSYSDYLVSQGGPAAAGKLEKFGPGTLTLSGANTYTGGTALKGGTLAVGNNDALGTGGLAMDDGTTLAFAADGLTIANPITMTGTNDPTFDTGTTTATLTGGITGAADLTKTGSGTLVLGAANNTYSGSTTVAAGTLRAGAVNAFSPASAVTVASGATLDTAGFSQTVAALTNAGTVSLLGSSTGSTLTVNGNYVGNNGLLKLGTALGGNASASDRLVINGSATGTTAVQVTNLAGLGGQTTGDGIQIISAAGGIASGAFSLASTVAAGAYDYRLNTTDTGTFLSSTSTVAPVTPTTPAGPGIVRYRAEVPLYAALPEQLRQANLAMLGSLHQRAGDDGVTGSSAASPEQGYRQAWGRIISVDRDIQQSGTVSPGSQGRLNGFQVGTDLWATPNFKTGIYVGQLDGDMKVSGFARGVQNYSAGSNDLRSQYLGAYATWKNDSGLYVDGVLQGGRHRTTANPTVTFESNGKGNSLLASIEAGQAFAIAPNWTVEPQLQLVHQRLSLDDANIVGALVQQDSHNGWTVRAGVRVKGQIETGAGLLQPYARVNVYKRSSGTDITRFIGPAAFTDIATGTGGTSSELAVGATWQLSQSTSLYGEVGKLWASGGSARTKSGINGSAGVKVRW